MSPATKHRPSTRRRWPAAILCLLWATPIAAQTDQVAALREGNRLFREGRLQEAYDAYLEGHDASAPHPVLYYNLGTATHQMNRLPEAILWYRRAAEINPGDPWLAENLDSARATLGLQPYPAPGLAAAISRQARILYYLAALIAWVGAGLWVARSRSRLRPTLTLLGVAAAIYGCTFVAARLTPVAAVVIEDCAGGDGDLPAGSEVWIARRDSNQVDIAAGGLQLACPVEAISPVNSWD